ncbi:MAG: threonine synthase [Clostridia bacterium]|nr:threonine synthase [Clostridia bacterium]
MKYISTRGGVEALSSAQAIKKGIADNGGLFVPDHIPLLTDALFEKLVPMTYAERAAEILSLFLDDYDKTALLSDCVKAYESGAFTGGAAPTVKLADNKYLLELFHGPTCAFKDMALQIMPRLLSRALKMTGEKKTAYILVATSGDTGKAALEGYRDVEGVRIKVFYPVDGVSDIQKLQMSTQDGANVSVQAIEGNFDDAQNGVKNIFSDVKLNNELHEKGYILTSANSINWGRLAPQIVYYISSYADLYKQGEIKLGEKISFCVPTGNFGNIFAGYLAYRMGLPVKRFICASNKNNILTDFLNTGVYDRNREFYQTVSPSMDILISSNLERLLYFVAGPKKTAGYMKQLAETGRYGIADNELKEIQSIFTGGYTDEDKTLETIKTTFRDTGALIDTHTAVAYSQAEKYVYETGEKVVTVSTASPYKFAADVLKALGKKRTSSRGALSPLYDLSSYTDTEIPAPLARLEGKAVRFSGAINKADMPASLFD